MFLGVNVVFKGLALSIDEFIECISFSFEGSLEFIDELLDSVMVIVVVAAMMAVMMVFLLASFSFGLSEQDLESRGIATSIMVVIAISVSSVPVVSQFADLLLGCVSKVLHAV